jgi:hypothetical protein
MAFGACKFCGEERELVDAHIIPKSFYDFRARQGPHYIFSAKLNHGPKKAPVGIYDDHLLCRECEGKFAYLDTYAAQKLKPWPRRPQLIRDETGFIIKLPDGSRGGYWLRDINVDRLKLFFCFLVWRCARTDREELAIALSDDVIYRVEGALKNKDASRADIHVVGSRYSERKYTSLFSPWPRSPAIGAPVNFVMYGLHFVVHFRAPEEVPEIALGASADWPIIFQEFKGTRLHELSMRLVKNSRDPWAGLRKRGLVA